MASAGAAPSRSWLPVLPTASEPTGWRIATASSHLRRLAENDDGFEQRRRRRLAAALAAWRKDRLERPQLLVEAPLQILSQKLENLPKGVRLESGRITVSFDNPQQALEKLLALAMAISNNFELFEKQVRSARG